ncbi:MAG: MerR family transcriptional regulator [Dehalococcoidia bacterium]|nr:MAG: MerR family transcriptional regulator [Dehalococcoidia bacterium]
MAGMTTKRAPGLESPSDQQAYLQIGEVAERTGVTQRTLRFYEEKGLLKPPSRLEGGFRLYSEEDVRRVEEIKRLQTLLGFTLADIKEMVEARAIKMQIRAEYRRDAEVSERKAKLAKAVEVTRRQIAIVDQKLAALQEMKTHLEQKLDQYNGWIVQLDEEAAAEAKS